MSKPSPALVRTFKSAVASKNTALLNGAVRGMMANGLSVEIAYKTFNTITPMTRDQFNALVPDYQLS